ncbi:unnamed protein product [Camellia sinensis]
MYTTSDHQMLQCQPRPLVMERKWKSNAAEIAPNCPRCASTNTKFCYYNNYSFSQPRYFCKGCRRYWTKGGSLRNVPVGGGCRKTRRAKASRSTITSHSPSPLDLPTTTSTDPSPLVPPGGSGGSDIDLADVFAKFLNQSSSVGDSQPTQLLDDGIPPQVFDQVQGEEGVHGFMGHDDLNCFGSETVLVDELGQELLWSESDANLPVFSMVEELQEFGLFSSDDDQSKISANLISDNNWSLFDLPAGL